MVKKNQSTRLTNQQKKTSGVIGIFGDSAKQHDLTVGNVALKVCGLLQQEYPSLFFQHRSYIKKEEINSALQKIDKDLGQTLFLKEAKIIPDGGIIEVRDDNNNWRVVLVSEAKFQGKDIENIQQGKLVGKKNDQDLMAAGNAIERTHKNISELSNFMLSESYFPYIIFLEGSNFLTEDLMIKRPDGREVILQYDSGILNRLDRLTSANYGMPINKNLCKNKFIKNSSHTIMLQAASLFTKGDGSHWEEKEMIDIMLDIAQTSLRLLSCDLFNQLTKK